jgi:DNA topoisomerase-2
MNTLILIMILFYLFLFIFQIKLILKSKLKIKLHIYLTMSSELFFDVQQKTDKQHILDNPDTYIGSVETIDADMWIMSEDSIKIVEKNINYIPGLFKLFDEGIVNCRDHVVRMKSKVDSGVENALPVSHIDISIESDGTITMINDGNGIDVAQKDGVWIPELVFGHLRTSTNYNKEEKKIVGGKNGFGFKLVLIWSSYGRIETVDHIRGLKYIQEYKNNLDEICKPSITKCKNKPYTKISFKPDFARLGISGLTCDMVSLLKKRVYDIGAITDKNVKVKYNNELIPIKNFEQYINMYIGDKSVAPRVYEESGTEGRWEYAVALTPTSEFVQISFVNGIHTSKGGKHVEYILNQIVRKLVEFIEKKKKTKVNPNTIKEQLVLFLRCDIENPAFDSQTKDYMNTPSSKFGSKCEVTDKFIEKVAKMGVMDAALQLTEVKDNKAAKKTDGTKSKSVRGIPKLTDANWAGTEKSSTCMLILCEGDSAKAGILSGLSSEDRNIVGVYPLKGKLLNVRGEPVKKIADNKEITEIKQILGLVTGKKYLNIDDVNKNLRYGKILFMTDQDLDGSHIKGLGINLFSCEWPTLSQIPGFIGFMNTPILKAKKGSNELNFYNDGEFEEWKEQNDVKGWTIKYYKGLGTSTGKEFREYFEDRKIVEFQFSGKESDDAVDMVFNKKRADDRKVWLKVYDRDAYLDTNKKAVSYEEFINRELIHFSKYDCDRSIPNLMDGLKISQRKIVFAAFKRKLTSEIKVAQFSGYVSEHSGYHHGEASLNGAIVGMAQNFVGSNNINLFEPNGQFGTRLQGGKDSASERYIFTLLNKITRTIFQQTDDNVLEYLNDDGLPVEPIYYAPIIPMILVNGSKGIGTGFSTDIMCYNPLQIIEYLENKLQDIEPTNIDFIPYYEGFNGHVSKIADDKFLIKGKYEHLGVDRIRVTELPVGHWTEDFKELLEHWCNPGEDKDKNKIPAIIKDYDDMSKDTNVDFTITFVKGKLEELEKAKGEHGCNGVEKLLKLYTTNTTTNMHLFDANDTLQKFEKVSDIIDSYYEVRLKLYQTRKEYMIDNLEKELILLSNKAKYIKENLDGTIDLRKKKKEQVVEMLQSKGYDIINDDSNYHYLIKMPMDSVTEENVEKLIKEHGSKVNELETIKSTSINKMWLNELQTLRGQYIEYKEERTRLMNEDGAKSKKKVVSKSSTKKFVKKQSLIVED